MSARLKKDWLFQINHFPITLTLSASFKILQRSVERAIQKYSIDSEKLAETISRVATLEEVQQTDGPKLSEMADRLVTIESQISSFAKIEDNVQARVQGLSKQVLASQSDMDRDVRALQAIQLDATARQVYFSRKIHFVCCSFVSSCCFSGCAVLCATTYNYTYYQLNTVHYTISRLCLSHACQGLCPRSPLLALPRALNLRILTRL